MENDLLNRREWLAGTASSLASSQSSPPVRQLRPNILHIMSDQQQWATLANRSECHTPNLNRLAEEGLLFERSYTPCAICCPARAMLLSGAYHWHNGIFNQVHSSPSVHRDMYPEVVLYSQRLREAGYRLGYVGKWHASYLRGPLDFGFHEVADLAGYQNAEKDTAQGSFQLPHSAERLRRTVTRNMRWPGSEPFPMWGYTEGPEEAAPEHYRTECAIRMLEKFTRGASPWHMEVHYIEPHDPYFPDKKFLDKYRPENMKLPESFHDDFHNKPGMHRREARTWGDVTPEDVQTSRAHYFAYAEQLDAQIGRLLAALDRSGQAGNTLVVFTSDHGDLAGAHRMWLKGWMPYEECYRVPLIVRWPGHVEPGGKTSALVQTHDLAHTYIAAAQASPLPFADGRSLLPLLRNPQRSDWTDQILCAFYGGEFLYTQRMAITGRYKYVFNGFDMDELYDLESDPHEMSNLIDYAPANHAASEMRGRLYDLMTQFGDPYAAAGKPVRGGEPPNRYGAARYLSRT
jgi:arylsulfatase A-like enzyme